VEDNLADALVHIIVHPPLESIQKNHGLVLLDYFDPQPMTNLHHHEQASNFDHQEPTMNLHIRSLLVSTSNLGGFLGLGGVVWVGWGLCSKNMRNLH
jgi:hypothetical protein